MNRKEILIVSSYRDEVMRDMRVFHEKTDIGRKAVCMFPQKFIDENGYDYVIPIVIKMLDEQK